MNGLRPARRRRGAEGQDVLVQGLAAEVLVVLVVLVEPGVDAVQLLLALGPRHVRRGLGAIAEAKMVDGQRR